jgi:transcriptional regulator with XRE-family HTH domain
VIPGKARPALIVRMYDPYRPLHGGRGPIPSDSALAGLRLIGIRLREARLGLGLTQRRLEQLSGIDQTTISRLENGRLTSLHLTRVGAIAMVLAGHWNFGHGLHPGCRLLETVPRDDSYRDDMVAWLLESDEPGADMPPTAST